MADDKTTKTPEQPVTDSGPGKETPPAPPKEPEKVSVSPEPEKKTEPEVKNPQVSVYNFAEIMKEKKVEERAAAPGVEKPDPAKTEKPEKQPEAPKKAEEKPKEPEQPKRRGRPPKADKDKDAAPKPKAPAQKPEQAVKKEPEKKTAPTVQTAPTPKEPEKPKDAPRRGKEQIVYIKLNELYECENIDELNELGHALLEVRDKGGLETFEAALVLGNHTRSVKDLINLTQNLDLYRFYPDISDDEGLGRLYADELGTIDIPEHIQNYFDYEAYGRDVRINEGGVFAPGGYVSAVPEGFKEYYHGPQDIPPEHRMSQCKALYKDHSETIMGNMDSIVFLGGREASTLKDISENWLGKATISMQTEGRSRGQSESYSQNMQRLGRELMTTSEITTMPGDKCILQLRGLPPFLSPKYDLKKHPNYKYTAEFDKKKNAFRLESLFRHRPLRLKPEDEYTVYEVDGSDTDEEADLLNFDDLDSDEFV